MIFQVYVCFCLNIILLWMHSIANISLKDVQNLITEVMKSINVRRSILIMHSTHSCFSNFIWFFKFDINIVGTVPHIFYRCQLVVVKQNQSTFQSLFQFVSQFISQFIVCLQIQVVYQLQTDVSLMILSVVGKRLPKTIYPKLIKICFTVQELRWPEHKLLLI